MNLTNNKREELIRSIALASRASEKAHRQSFLFPDTAVFYQALARSYATKAIGLRLRFLELEKAISPSRPSLIDRLREAVPSGASPFIRDIAIALSITQKRIHELIDDHPEEFERIVAIGTNGGFAPLKRGEQRIERLA